MKQDWLRPFSNLGTLVIAAMMVKFIKLKKA
jgi:hypothetical protein